MSVVRVRDGGAGRLWRRWARFITRARWSVVAAAVALLAVGAGWGSGVFAELGSGGFADPGSQSASADRVIRAVAVCGQ